MKYLEQYSNYSESMSEVLKEVEGVTTDKEECLCCMEPLEQFIELKCGHKFHEECITPWFLQLGKKWIHFKSHTHIGKLSDTLPSCPYCRTIVDFLPVKEGEKPVEGVHISRYTILQEAHKKKIVKDKATKKVIESNLKKGAGKTEIMVHDIYVTTPIKPTTKKCEGLTKKGTPCKKAAGSNGYCWQHVPN